MTRTTPIITIKRILVAAFAMLLLWASSVAWADDDGDNRPVTYKYKVIADELFEPFASDINDRRKVVGWFGDPTNNKGFSWRKGRIEIIEAPGADLTFANGINNRNIIAGHAINGDLTAGGPVENRGFVKAGRFVITINFKTFNSWAFDISNRASIVGIYCEDGDVPGCLNEPVAPFGGVEVLHAYLIDRRGPRTIDPPGSLLAAAFGVNDRGDAVGGFEDAVGGHGFLRDKHGNYTIIDFPGASFTEVRGVNNRGDTVGQYTIDPVFFFPFFGFVRTRDGEFTTVNYPGALATIVTGINNRGDLVGIFLTEEFELKSFVALKSRGRDDDDDEDDDD